MERHFYTHTLKPLFSLLVLLLLVRSAGAQFTVSGSVETPGGNKATGMAILVTGTENKVAYTDANGNYSFTLQTGGAYKVQPLSCEENPLNGVTTYDVVLVSRHIL